MSRLLRAIIIGLALQTAVLAQNLPTIKAKVTQPVLQELMGGCSLKCAFPWTVEVAPAQPGHPKSYAVTETNDDCATTAWIDHDSPTSIGAKLTFRFPKKLPREIEETPFYGFDIINGDWKTEESWKAHARVKKVRMYYNNQPLYIVTFADTRRWQEIVFDDILAHSGDRMTLEILETYPGAQSSSVAITEVVLQGAH